MSKAIARTELLVVGELGARRQELADHLVELFLESFVFEDRQMVADKVIFRDPDTKLELYWSADGTLLGFTSIGWTTLEHEGRTHGVMNMGMYMRKGARGQGGRSSRRVLLELARMRSRHPRRQLFYVGEMVSPVSYHQAVKIWPTVYPSFDETPDARTAELARRVVALRGMENIDGNPWLARVPLPFGFRDGDRMDAYVQQKAGNPHVEFFMTHNPRYRDGHWLVILVPFTAKNVFGAITRLARRG